MPWKHCRISISASYERLLEGVGLLALANGDPPDIALFTRTTPCRRQRVLLLTPRAVELAGDALPESWKPCEAPELFEWDAVFGPADACARFGLNRPSFGRRAAPTPPLVFGAPPATPPDPR